MTKASLLDRLRAVGCDREPFTPDHANCVCRLTNEAANEIERLLAALTEISEGRGPFSQDQLTFATNTIESMKQLALDALTNEDEKPPREEWSSVMDAAATPFADNH
jgi:hypothetical protein